MDVTVKGPDGKFVTSLRKEDFQVIDDGGTQEIQSVMPPITPWNIVFLLDLDALLLLPDSYSGDPAFAVRGAERAEETWRQIGDGVAAFYRSLRSQDRFAIDLFVDDRTAQMLPWRNGGQTGVWTASRPDLRPVSQSGAPPEKNLYRAIRTALERLRGTKGHQVVVLLTDGRDGRLNGAWLRTRKMVSLIDPFYGLPNSDEQQEFEQLLAAVKKSGIRFFIASVNGDRSYHQGQNSAWAWTSMGLVPEAAQNFSSLHQAADERLSRLARTSGGAIFSRGKNPDAAVAIARLAERLSLDRTYRITYSRSVHEATEHGVEVILQNPRLQVEQLLSDRFWSLQ
jgi:hypothetical protein